jgi:hypothetical protein
MKLSLRALMRRQFASRHKRAVLYSDSSDEEDFALARATLEASRYLARPGSYASQHLCADVRTLLRHRPDFFRHQTRMCQQTFLRLLDMIWDNNVFHNFSHVKQRSPGLQLYVFLQVLGHDGNGLTNASISGMHAFGEGTVSLYVARVSTAIRMLRRRFVRWPTAEARASMAARFYAKYGFYACGILDGTFFYFNQAPSVDPHNFFTRKKKAYGLNTQLICDLDWKITGYVLGWPGCTPDTQAYETSDFFLHSARYFSPGDCVLADKGYTPRLTMCVPYDEPEVLDTADSSAEEKRFYNDGLKKGRLLIERVNAMLKNRFTWLKGMRFQVRCASDFEKCNHVIEALIILHNFMMSSGIQDMWSDMRRPECDEWENALQKVQGKIARATATAAASVRSTMREQELLSRMERVSQFLLWKEYEQFINIT